ncbi:unnamed protein product [Prunus armeniaca]|uniref:TFIIS N-terminal domain-containing protein n=1 Tax=Prunus armeniaca TaxID=36596 RepID=A0A6J5TP65_PRUAR|nr:unnamed protein product [Prunus armeniaca]
MTLEDFFTLTEMKDGLTAPSRVEELVNVMQSEKDSIANNVGDATRQWAAVASTIAATENKDCLDLFIQLDGLWFVDRWLKDAQNLGNDTNESFVEESITALLRALEKLHIDNKRSISSGIWSTVKSLLGHKSTMVQDRARMLFDSWKQDVENAEVLCDDGSSKILEEDSKASAVKSTSEVGTNRENHTSGPARDELSPLRTSGGLQLEGADAVLSNKQSPTHKLLDNADIKDRSPDPLASAVVMDPIQESPIKDESSMCSVGGTTSIGTSSFPAAKLSNVDGHSDTPKSNELSKNENQDEKVNSSPQKLGVTDISSGPGLVEPGVVSSGADGSNSQVFATDSALQKSVNANQDDSCQKFTALANEGTAASDPKGVMDDVRAVNHCNTTVQDGECCSNTPHDLSGNGSMSGKLEDLETSSRMADPGAVDEDMEHVSDEGEELTTADDIDHEYGMVDALEVARQVAQEVEREVVDYREPYCSSSSEKISEGGLRRADSPDSINGEQDLPTHVSPKEAATEQSHSAEVNPEREGHIVNSENVGTIPEQCTNDMESSQVTEAAQEPELIPEKSLCNFFDLNQEVCSDEMDRPVNPVSTPIPVSRPVAAAGLPVAPLQFEGAIGWKGSAATSAFRRASPRRFSDGDKNLSTGATSDGSKQRLDCLDIDLNVAEGGDDLGKQIPVSSGLPSGESSVEVSQNRSGRPNLDLNRIDDDGDALPSGLRMEGQFLNNRNGRRSPSPASSSSSMQPSMRNFDLNDRPYFHNDSTDQGPGKSSQTANAYGWPKPDASVISIMGTRVEINRTDAPQTLSLANGKAIETAADVSMARTGNLLDMGSTVSYTHSPVFGYNGLATGPTMSFSSAMYGPGGTIPYMVDSRGAPVVPQIMASPSVVPPPFSQSPFIMNLSATAQPGLNGAGPSRPPSFDLNSGFMVEGGNRDSGLRHLFIHGQSGRSMEDHLRNNSQPPPSSSTVGGKRKEPDSGWESFPFSYRHQQQQPPWR